MTDQPILSNNIREYVVTHRAFPPYTVKRSEEVVPLCFDHGSQYIETVLELGGMVRLGKDLPEGICVKCVQKGGG